MELPVVEIFLDRGHTGTFYHTELLTAQQKGVLNQGLGFNIKGGVDAPHVPGEAGIFVTKVRENGAAFRDGRIKEGDRILVINGENIERVTHQEAVTMFVNSGSSVHLKVQHGAEKILRKRQTEAKKIADEENEGHSGYLRLGAGLSITAMAMFVLFRFYRKGYFSNMFSR